MRPEVTVEAGPRPGLLGDVVALHGRYYARNWDVTLCFEIKVAREMGDFLMRYDAARDLVLSVVENERVLGSITLDGSDPDEPPGQGHLRWFIMDGALAGRGLGSRLLDQAIEFARHSGLKSAYLTTFRGLEPAGILYTRAGFRLTAEEPGESWGRPVIEQRFDLPL